MEENFSIAICMAFEILHVGTSDYRFQEVKIVYIMAKNQPQAGQACHHSRL
ncbi:hypothetical protein D3OALGA1CA_5027 [Olavius algarvensis associated proteobacterium Delta 3]|nr:hypothetical protein D3OALGA1CA_5027 [Olavius algarvensis associated proteobacterium Delta 3]